MYKIGIHSVPRSGSTWLGEILNSSPLTKCCFQPLFSHKYKDFLSLDSKRSDIEKFFDLLATDSDEFVNQTRERMEGKLPTFEKSNVLTHVIYKEVRYNYLVHHLLRECSDLKIICLIRDPIQVINSWYKSPREFHPNWNLDSELMLAPKKNLGRIENDFGLTAWIQTTENFEHLANLYPNRVLLIEYSKLLSNGESDLSELFDFVSVPLSIETITFFRRSHEITVEGDYSVFRAKGPSKDVLPHRIRNRIVDEVKNAGLDKYISEI
jgi:hypothetical protein